MIIILKWTLLPLILLLLPHTQCPHSIHTRVVVVLYYNTKNVNGPRPEREREFPSK